MSRTDPAMPWGLRLSLHSPQPPSQCSASTLAIFMAGSRGLQAERAPGLGGKALERRGVHLGPRSQDEPIDPGRRVGVERRLVRNIQARRRHADLEPPKLRRPRVLLARLAQRRDELLRLVDVQTEAVPAVALSD